MQSHSNKQQEKIKREQSERLPKLLKITLSGQIVVFVDECMFTSRSIFNRSWRHAFTESLFSKARLSFKAIGVVAAINLQGQVVALIVKDGSIKVPELK